MTETFWKLVQCPNCNCSTGVRVTVSEAWSREALLHSVSTGHCAACKYTFFFGVTSFEPFTVEVFT
jgi:hypothetical protein